MVISDALQKKKLAPVKDWYKCRIQAPSQLTIDAGREAMQEREDVSAGLMTMREHYGKRGMDWQSECQQRGKELKYVLEKSKIIAEELDVEFSTVVNLMTKGEFIGSSQQEENDEENKFAFCH